MTLLKLSTGKAKGKITGQVKCGRPSSISIELMYEAKKIRDHNSKPIPQMVIRKDNTDHFPICKEKKSMMQAAGYKQHFLFSKLQHFSNLSLATKFLNVYEMLRLACCKMF